MSDPVLKVIKFTENKADSADLGIMRQRMPETGVHPKADQSLDFTREEASRGPCDESGGYLYQREVIQNPKLLEQLAQALAPYLPYNGVVRVEPCEVVLKRFQQDEVKRILEATAALPAFSKRLIAFLEAKGQGVKKAAAVSTVTGKRFANMARDCADEYGQIRDLAAGNWIREDTKNSIVFANLGKTVKARTGETEPSNEDIDAILGQVMVTLQEG